MKRIILFLKTINPEAWIWAAGLIVLYFIHAESTSHFSVCPFKNLGVKYCPGCGLGRSVHYFLHFQFSDSFNVHPLGFFAVAVLLGRIAVLVKSSWEKILPFAKEKYDD